MTCAKKVEARGVLLFARVLCDLWLGKKAASARCAVFYHGFCTPKAPEVDAILFFTSILNHLPLPPARLAPDAGPTPSRRETPPPVWRECDLRQKQEFYMRVATFSENLVSVTRFKGYHKWYPAKGYVNREQPDSRLTLHAKACAAGFRRESMGIPPRNS